ncbi:MAG: acyl-CoA thioester hydrolase [Parasphingorhabdus sp.]|jgi:acyl-CoA thioester hydrolase
MCITIPQFEHNIRIYYEDTDAAGIVYYANYLKFIERGRTEWLRSLGFELSEIERREQRLFAVSRVDARYHKPAQLDDQLVSIVKLIRMRKASLELNQILKRGSEIVFSALVVLACVDSVKLKPRAIPKIIYHDLEKWITQ